MSEELLDKMLKTKKVSTQVGQHNLHYERGKHGFNKQLILPDFWLHLGTVNT